VTNERNPFWISKECWRINHASTTTSSKDSYSNPCPNTSLEGFEAYPCISRTM